MTCTADRHGDLTAYRDHRCRCPEGRAANTRAAKRYRLRLLTDGPDQTDATGTQRRLQALHAAGWRLPDLAPLAGVSSSRLHQLMSQQRVTRVVADRIHQLYVELADQPGPSRKTASYARNRGWLTADWWDDDTIDDPRYDPVLEHAITAAELEAQEAAHRLLEVYRLTEAGHSAKDIGRRIGAASRTVVRYRAQQSEAS